MSPKLSPGLGGTGAQIRQLNLRIESWETRGLSTSAWRVLGQRTGCVQPIGAILGQILPRVLRHNGGPNP